MEEMLYMMESEVEEYIELLKEKRKGFEEKIENERLKNLERVQRGINSRRRRTLDYDTEIVRLNLKIKNLNDRLYKFKCMKVSHEVYGEANELAE